MKTTIFSIFLLLAFLPLVMAVNTSSSTYNVDTFSTVISSNEATSGGYDAQTTMGVILPTNGTTSTYTFSTITTNTSATGTTDGNETTPDAGDGTATTTTTASSSTTTTRTADTYNIAITDAGSKDDYIEDDELVLTVGSEKFTLEVTSIKDDTVFLYVADQDRTISIASGTKKKADLNFDGVYDVFITASEVTEDGIATLFIELYSEKEDLTEEVEEVEVLTEEEQKELFIEEGKLTNWIALGIAALAIVLIILIAFLISHYRKK
ncbi:hypothetical protein CL616_04915 [archaeon]|nr:hypothetical protein [archaeon]